MPEQHKKNKKVSFLQPAILDEDIERMVQSIKSTWLVAGEQTRIFENDLKKYLQVADAVMLGSCTSALHISLILAGVGEGDEVITTPLSWVATSNVILHRGAKVVFADVDPKTGILDLDEVEKKITPKTKAIIVVHYCCAMADMKKLSEIGKRYNVKIIEDSAHALESIRDEVRPGHLSFASCLSFHSAKNITSGQGGALITNDPELGKIARILRRDGVTNINDKRVMTMLGDKYDATDFQAALLIGQLERVGTTHRKREQVFNRYAEAFTRAGVKFPHYDRSQKHAGHMFTVWVDPAKRDAIRKEMSERGIDTSIHYGPIHLEPYYIEKFGFKRGDFSNAEKIGDMTITLPTYSGLTEEEQDYVIENLLSLI